MRILVYGAGNMGSLYAGFLKESGHDVSILARGRRLEDIREKGIRLEEAHTGRRTISRVEAVERLDPDDMYDLVLVVLPKNGISEALPVLGRNHRVPGFLFFGNNAAGPSEMAEALGRDRVLLGFPGAAATPRGDFIRYLILSSREQPTTLGELDGTTTGRIEELADAFETAGFPVSICANMEAWLKTHAAEIVPTASALYMAKGDIGRLVGTRDALVLMLRAIGEGYRALSALGVPITPRNHRVFPWLPEPMLLALARRMLGSAGAEIKIGHALSARGEMKTLAEEFRALIRTSGVPTPSIDLLHRHLDPRVEPLPKGSSKIPLRWRFLWLALGSLVASVALGARST